MRSKVEVAIIGAGLAGLNCARELTKANIDFQIIEATDRVGGRVTSDVVDGFILDRGFQLYNPSYAEGKRLLDYQALDFKSFTPGIAIRDNKRLRIVVDPFRSEDFRFNVLKDLPGGITSKLGLLRYFVQNLLQADANIAISKDISAQEALTRTGVKNDLLEKLFRPFLQGVFLESNLDTSRKFLDVVLKTFLRGIPCVPSQGMKAIPEQIASKISSENIIFNNKVMAITGNTINTEQGSITAKKIVIATDPTTAISWLELPAKTMHAVSTWYFKADQEVKNIVKTKPILFVDGQNKGPITNAVVMTNAAPSYSANNEVLVSASGISPFLDTKTPDVKHHLAKIFGVDTSKWELIKKYEIKNALPAMNTPYSLVSSNQISENLFVAGDHRATSSTNGSLLSGRYAAALVKVSLGL
jgi:hypothetical protein